MKTFKYSILSLLACCLMLSCNESAVFSEGDLFSKGSDKIDISVEGTSEGETDRASVVCNEILLNAGPISMNVNQYEAFQSFFNSMMYGGVSIMTEDCCIIHHVNAYNNQFWAEDVYESIQIDPNSIDEDGNFEFSVDNLKVLCFDCIGDPNGGGGGDRGDRPTGGEYDGIKIYDHIPNGDDDEDDCDICEYLGEPLYIVQGTGSPVSTQYGSGQILGTFELEGGFQGVDIKTVKKKGTDKYLRCQGSLIGN